MKIYTKSGDKGETSLFSGKRVSKSDQRFKAIGSIDELNSHLGLIVSSIEEDEKLREERHILINKFYRIQSELLQIGADLATPLDANPSMQKKVPRITPDKTRVLEEEIDKFDSSLPALTNFVLPGGHVIAAQIQVARSVCRRAERQIVSLSEDSKLNPEVLKYINRLSDWLFVLARYMNSMTKSKEQIWK